MTEQRFNARWLDKRLLCAVGTAICLAIPRTAAANLREESDTDPWRISFTPYFWAREVDASVRIRDDTINFDADFKGFSDGRYDPRGSGLYLELLKKKWGGIVRLEFIEAEAAVSRLDLDEVEVNAVLIDAMLAREFAFSLKGTEMSFLPYAGSRYRDHRQTVRFTDGTQARVGNFSFEPVVGARLQWRLNRKMTWAASAEAAGFGVGEAAESHLSTRAEAKLHLSREFNLVMGYRYDDFDIRGGNYAIAGSTYGPYVGLALDFLGENVPAVSVWDGRAAIAGEELPEWSDDILPDLDLTPEEERTFILRWIDRGHSFVNRTVDAGVGTVDGMMMRGEGPVLPREKSRLAFALHTEVAEDNGVQWKLRPRYEANVHVPNVERNIRLRVTSRAVDEITGSDPLSQETGVNAGLEARLFGLKKTKVSVGVRSSLDVYGAVAWMPEWRGRRWRIGPKLKAFYRSDKGFGGEASAIFNYRIKDRFRGSYVASILEEEALPDTEWLHSLNFIYLFEGTELDYHRLFLTRILQRGSIDEGTFLIRWTPIYYRTPIYRKWLYFEIGPEVKWRRDDDWEPVPAIRFAFQALFWGTQDR